MLSFHWLTTDSKGKKIEGKVTGKTGNIQYLHTRVSERKKHFLATYPCLLGELFMYCICKLYGVQVVCMTDVCKYMSLNVCTKQLLESASLEFEIS